MDPHTQHCCGAYSSNSCFVHLVGQRDPMTYLLLALEPFSVFLLLSLPLLICTRAWVCLQQQQA
jgi:hypothetical protein